MKLKRLAAVFVTESLLLSSVIVPVRAEESWDESLVGKPFAENIVPGIIQAENFNIGENGVAYYDSEVLDEDIRKKSPYRQDSDVNIQSGYSGYWITPMCNSSEWLCYTVNALKAGEYDMYNATTAWTTTTNIKVNVNGTDVITGVNVPITTRMGAAADEHYLGTVYLNAGLNVIKITHYGSGGGGTDWFRLEKKKQAASYEKISYYDRQVPCSIGAWAFDRKGAGVSYLDNDNENLGKVFRKDESVDVYKDSYGVYILMEAGEWINYTLNQNSEKNAAAEVYASSEYGAKLSLLKDGAQTAVLEIPENTKRQWMRVGNVGNISGETKFTLKLDSGTAKIYILRFEEDGTQVQNQFTGIHVKADNIEEQQTVVLEKNIDRRIYLSENGDDKNNGSENSPVKTIKRAQELATTARETMTGDIEIIFDGGEYKILEPMIIDENLSGANGYDIVYRSAEGETATLSAAIAVEKWNRVSDRIWKAQVPEYISALYINGEQKAQASSDKELKGSLYVDDDSKKITGFVIKDTDVIPGMIAEWNIGNRNIRIPVEMVEADAVIFDKTYFESVQRLDNKIMSPGEHNSFKLLNAKEFLKADTWYYDFAEGAVYYCSDNDDDLNDSEAKYCGQNAILDIKNAYNVRFENITFEYSGENLASYVPVENNVIVSGDGKYSQVLSAVSIQNSESIAFVNNKFNNIGGLALNVSKNNEDILIKGNEFKNIGASAVKIGSAEDFAIGKSEQLNENIVFTENTVNNTGTIYKSSPAIDVCCAVNTTVSGNTVENSAYSGIFAGSDFVNSNLRNGSGVIISENTVSKCNTLFSPGGSIHLSGGFDNAFINANILSGSGIFADASAYGFIIRDNDVTADSKWINIWSTDTKNIVIRNNTYKSSKGYSIKGVGIVYENNIER